MLDMETKKTILTAQRNEITEHFVYDKLSQSIRDSRNKNILERISRDELKHYHVWKEYTREEVKPDKFQKGKYYVISRILGITFGMKLMERAERQAQVIYEKVSKFVPAAKSIIREEEEHEKQLIDLIDDERLQYIGSIVRGSRLSARFVLWKLIPPDMRRRWPDRLRPCWPRTYHPDTLPLRASPKVALSPFSFRPGWETRESTLW
jgi:rubrerythrin